MTFAFTVTAHVAVLLPSVVFTVIVALPADFAITTPEEDTSATDGAFDDQVTDLSVAFDGDTVAVNVWVSPSVIVRVVISRLTPVTDITLAITVTVQVAVLLPSSVVTVITDVPTAIACTCPLCDTIATSVLLDSHETSLTEAFEGLITHERTSLSPSVIISSDEERVTDSTATYFPFLPSCVTTTSFVPELDLNTIFPSRSYSLLAAAEKLADHS